MALERLGRIVAVALLALLAPVACAAIGVGTPGASGLPSSPRSASPAAQQGDGAEASTAAPPTSEEAFLTIVRQTGLWAVPASQQAQRRASNAELKVLGRELATDLKELDGETTAIAGRLELNLPDQAGEEEKGRLTELAGKSGGDFDLTFASRTRDALGEMYLVAAQTRAGARTEEVRTFASTVSDVVDRYLTDLTETGLVTGSASPEPTRQGSTTETAEGSASSTPETTPVASTSTTDGGGAQAGLIALVCVAEVGMTVGLVSYLRSR
jgi:putative membrane protein